MLQIHPIDGLEDPRVADYRNLRDPELCRDAGLFLVEGRLNVQRLLAIDRFRVRSLFLTETSLAALRPVLLERARGLPIYVAANTVLKGVVGYNMHHGCLAACERGPRPRVRDGFASTGLSRLWLALEELANPDNVGGIFRNAAAFGVEGVVLSEGCADPLYRKSIRVSMGAALSVPYEFTPALPETLGRMAEADLRVVGLCTHADARPLESLRLAQPGVVLVVGSEAHGLSDAVLSACHERIAITMAADFDSLNANVAAAIALHHVVRESGDG